MSRYRALRLSLMVAAHRRFSSAFGVCPASRHVPLAIRALLQCDHGGRGPSGHQLHAVRDG